MAERRARVRDVAAALLGLLAAPAFADETPSWRDRVTFTLSDRARGEFVDWFDPPPGAATRGAERYAFFANQLRAGVKLVLPHLELVLEGQDTRLVGLPDDASLAPPVGNLGPGAIYFANTHDTDQGEPFLKQGFLTFRRGGLTAQMGRFEVRDGLETIPGDATLATLKRTRIAERLIGTFDFTHVTRSFDGLRFAWDRPDWNATAFATRPTHGGFEVSANRELDMTIAGVALTAKRLPEAPPIDLRAFWLYYADDRDTAVKVDNRPLPVRDADREPIVVHTAGSHAVGVWDLGPGRLDVLGWGVLQTGDWGVQDHFAWAWALETGWQMPTLPAAPWVRIGWNRSAGDDDPTDGDHRTFFQLLPTARIYAQLPFYNLMNDDDVFASLILRPHPKLSLRLDYHRLRLSERADLWYAGGGATNDDIFGFSGQPSGGDRDLAHLGDLSVSASIHPRVTVNGYYGHAFGGEVVRATFPGTAADYGFVEVMLRY